MVSVDVKYHVYLLTASTAVKLCPQICPRNGSFWQRWPTLSWKNSARSRDWVVTWWTYVTARAAWRTAGRTLTSSSASSSNVRSTPLVPALSWVSCLCLYLSKCLISLCVRRSDYVESGIQCFIDRLAESQSTRSVTGLQKWQKQAHGCRGTAGNTS